MKSECSLAAYTEKDVNKTILSISQQPHTQQNFSRQLALKESFQKDASIPKTDQLLKIINVKTIKREQQDGSNLCNCCFQVMGTSKNWCKICGHHTCKKCLIRYRQIKDESKVLFCEKCDSTYLRAIDGIQFFNKIEILQRTFKRLINEQEGIQKLVSFQRSKYISKESDIANYAAKGAKTAKLLEQNKIMKTRCGQLKKKVEFGREINRQLKKKLHILRKQQKQSFGTVSNHQDYNEMMIENRRDSLHSEDMSRQSLLTSAAERQQQPQKFIHKCKCELY